MIILFLFQIFFLKYILKLVKNLESFNDLHRFQYKGCKSTNNCSNIEPKVLRYLRLTVFLTSLWMHVERNFDLRVLIVLESLGDVPFVAIHILVCKPRVLNFDVLEDYLEFDHILNPILHLRIRLVQGERVRTIIVPSDFQILSFVILIHIEHKKCCVVLLIIIFKFN